MWPPTPRIPESEPGLGDWCRPSLRILDVRASKSRFSGKTWRCTVRFVLGRQSNVKHGAGRPNPPDPGRGRDARPRHRGPLGYEHDYGIGPYVVYSRPPLAEFLAFCSICFRLAIWSSAGDDYVRDVVGRIVSPRIELAFTWGWSRCVQSLDRQSYDVDYIKDLKKVKRLGYDLRQVLIIDDTPRKVRRHYGNAVYIPPFTGNPEDRTLLRLADYLALLRDEPDVRVLEKRGWSR